MQPLIQDYFEVITEKNKDSPIYINFDEIGTFFECSESYTLDIEGRHVVGVRSTGQDKKRFTFIPIVTSDGKFLPPVLIFKTMSKHHQNEENYFRNLLSSVVNDKIDKHKALLFANENAWCTSHAMRKRIIPHLKKSIRENYGGDRKIVLVFDNFSGHITDSVLNKLNHEGITFYNISLIIFEKIWIICCFLRTVLVYYNP